MKVALCVPIHSTAKAGFVKCLANLIDFSHRAKFTDQNGARASLRMETIVLGSSLVSQTRNAIVRGALTWGAEWLLWLDSDQTFPADTLGRLLSRQQSIVGCNYRARTTKERVGTTAALRDGAETRIMPEGDGIEEVLYMGLGVCLTSAEVFKKMKAPYFQFTEAPDGGAIGEDVYFFKKAKSLGFTPYVDHALSREIGHISDIELKLCD